MSEGNDRIQKNIIFIKRLMKEIKSNRNGGAVVWLNDIVTLTEIEDDLTQLLTMREQYLPKHKADHDS